MSDTVIQSYLPVFRHYLDRITGLALAATSEQLAARLAPDGFTALRHFAIAQGYVLRSLLPVLARDMPELPEVADRSGLKAQGGTVRAILDHLSADDFIGSAARQVSHTAGHATLTQPALDYISLYAAPNFFFHLGQGYAILRANGAEIGKGDFDGFHSYPKGFSFVTGTG